MTTPAQAQYKTFTPKIQAPPKTHTSTTGSPRVPASGPSLPFTGANLALVLALAVVIVCCGIALRRRHE
jgi:hypothetical protein